jgi:hypothetical protein
MSSRTLRNGFVGTRKLLGSARFREDELLSLCGGWDLTPLSPALASLFHLPESANEADAEAGHDHKKQ